MKQLLFMIPTFLIGTAGNFTHHPYLGVLVYYLFAVLRPQFIWQWSLPDVAWSFYVSISAIIATLAWRTGALSFDEDQQEIQTNIGHYTVLAFAIWIIVTYFTAINREAAYPFFIEYLKLFAMFVVARYALSSVRHMWIIYLAIALALCYISYEVNDIYFSKGYLYIYKLGYCGLDNNGAALMLAMGVPLCLFAWDGMTHWVRWFFLLIIPVIIHAVLTSYSRGAMVSLIAVVPFLLLRARRRGQLLIVLAGIVWTVPFMAGKEIRERFFTIEQHEIDESANSRKNSWAIGWKMAMEHPVFGMGIRNSNLYTFAYGADMEGRTIHSQWIQTAADSGIVALVLYVCCFLAMFYCGRRVRSFYGKRDDTEARHAVLIVNGCEVALLLFCVGATFLSLENFELPYILLLLSAQTWAVCRAKYSLHSDDAGDENELSATSTE